MRCSAQANVASKREMPEDQRAAVLKALAEPTRQRIVAALIASPTTVKVLSDNLNVAQYQVSKHLAVLRDAGIVEAEADWRFRTYRIATKLQPGLQQPEPALDFGWAVFSVAKFVFAE